MIMRLGRIRVLGICLCGLLMISCSKGNSELNSLPPTMTGTMKVQPQGRQTKELYDALVKLGDGYGLTSYGDGATDGINWAIQVFCGKNGTAIAHTAEDGDLILFQTYTYGFKRTEDYEHYKSEMLRLMKQFGTISNQRERKPLSKEDLIARERYMGLDLTTQCEPVTRNM